MVIVATSSVTATSTTAVEKNKKKRLLLRTGSFHRHDNKNVVSSEFGVVMTVQNDHPTEAGWKETEDSLELEDRVLQIMSMSMSM